MTLVQEVEFYGPLFERDLGLKPWDLERMSARQVLQRLELLKQWQQEAKQLNSDF